MSPTRRLLKTACSIHLYLGVFATPASAFFAFTGAMQTFSLHETTRGSSYAPPAWLASMAQLHKKHTPVLPVRRQRPPPANAPAANPGAAPMVVPLAALPATRLPCQPAIRTTRPARKWGKPAADEDRLHPAGIEH